MNVYDMMTSLQDLLDAGTITNETEIRFGSQPRHPLEYTICDEIFAVEFMSEKDCDAACDNEDDRNLPACCKDARHGGTIVYIGEGAQIGYLAGTISETIWGNI
jgi:hypothetical protein